MRDDLGGTLSKVHAMAAAVLDFWFALPPERHFAKDAALDREIDQRFGETINLLLARGTAYWRDDSQTLLAAVIVLDQFTRNTRRGSPGAFAGDPSALELTRHAIAQGWDADYPPDRRVFLYLPLMHAEDRETQALSVACYEALGIAHNLAFARDHAEVIDRYGRFPSRNAALSRASTAAERAYLSRLDAGW